MKSFKITSLFLFAASLVTGNVLADTEARDKVLKKIRQQQTNYAQQ